MKVVVTNLYTDRHQLFEGAEDSVRQQLLFAFPFLRPVPPDTTVEDLLEYLDWQQVYDVNVMDNVMDSADFALTKAEQNLGSEAQQSIADQLGYSVMEEKIFAAAKFLAGDEASEKRLRASLYANDGDLEAAALQAYGLELSEANLRALRAVVSFLGAQKSESDPLDLKKVKVQAMMPEGQDVAESVQRAFLDQFVFPVDLGGKHSAGIRVARDEQSKSTWLLKPGSGKQSPAAGAREEGASQSRREAAFYHVAKLWGLYHYLPRCELLQIDDRECAVMRLLPTSFQSLEKWRQKDPQFVNQVLQPLAQEGVLHRFAVLDAVCGNPDRHGANEMMNPDKEFRLIDHGSAFAGDGFAPAIDQDSFIPYYLRVWAPQKAFNKMTPEGKLHFLPRVSSSVANMLLGWLQRLSEDELAAELQRYGIEPEPALTRLRHFKGVSEQGLPVDEAVNRFWSGVDALGKGRY